MARPVRSRSASDIPAPVRSDPPVHYFERVGSTMDIVHALAEADAPAGAAVHAGEQLEGRGSRGRSWHSPPGGLWLSVLLRPVAVGGIEVVSLRVGLAVAAAVEAEIGLPIQLKWPNDLMLEQRKVGGILCEARWQGGALGWVAAGIGINVQNPVPIELTQSAVALGQVRPGITPEQIARPIIVALRQVDLTPERLLPPELVQFDQRDWLRGKEIAQPVRGRAAGVRADGSLLIQTRSAELVALRSNSIELASAAGDR